MAKRQTKKSLPPAVLVAEGEPTVRALEESIIAELGYETFSAANAREALAVLDDGAPITLLFTDINMPDGPDGLDGLELAQRAVELRPDLRVIYTTGGGLTDGMTALFVEGGTFLPKPFTREQLIAAIRGDIETASADRDSAGTPAVTISTPANRNSNEPQTDGERMTVSSQSVITFPVTGIFGAGRLASRLKELESVDLIGPWHVGHWIDYTHTAIRIRFSSPADAGVALSNLRFSAGPQRDAPESSVA